MVRRRGMMHRRVVAAKNHLHALQPQHAICLGPAPVVTDNHACDAAVGAPDAKTQVADFEIALFQVLERRLGPVLGMARQVNLAVLTDDRAVAADEDGAIEAALAARLRLELAIAQVKTDTEIARFIE